MLVVVSDLHMTDRTTGSSVSDAELSSLVRELTTLEPTSEPLTLLLLGDVVDLLRSEEWDKLWKAHPGAAPWSSLGREFSGFEEGYQEAALLNVIKGIERKYGGFFAALGALKYARESQVRYVIGNHDFMLQLSQKAREKIVELFCLDHDSEQELPLEYLDKKLDVYADHGHRHDVVNWHERSMGRWALGDAIVLRVVNRFAALTREVLHLKSATPLGKAVDEIDNIEPNVHVPLYVEWLATTMLASDADRRRLKQAWRDTVNEFLALPEFQEARYKKQADVIKWVRGLYQLFDVNALLKQLSNIPVSLTRNGHIRYGHLVKTSARLRVFGHTHEPGVFPLATINGRRTFYVNTGTWRSSTARIVISPPPLDFAAQRVSTMLIVRASGEFELTRRARCP